MSGKLLVPENIATTDGAGPTVELSPDPGKLIILTLSIDRVLEQEALQVSIWGSEDQQNWGLRPLTSFPPKCYCGIYSQLLNLSKHPGVRYVRAEWKVSRWSKPAGDPLFEFCVFAEESGARLKKNPAPAQSAPAAAVA